MAQTQDISCGLDFMSVPDISACLTEALQNKYKFAVLPIVHPRLRRHYIGGNAVKCGFTRSDMLLAPQDWTVRIVGKLSPYLDVDNNCPAVRTRHEDCLNEELAYCRGLGLPALMFTLRGSECNNLARILQNYYLQSHNPSVLWVRVPMKAEHMTSQEDDDDLISVDETSYDEPWRWWSRFQERMEWDKRVGVVLELSADLPPARVFARWLGEPVKCVVVPTSLFHLNKKGYPVLSRAHQTVVRSFVEHDAQVLISGAHRSAPLHYIQYLYHLWDTRPHKAVDDPMLAYARGWEDYLQTPLQPLADNLDTHTYNVFEKDPVKYDQYQRAIASALLHLRGIQQPESHDNKSSTNVGTPPNPANTKHQTTESPTMAQTGSISSPTEEVSLPPKVDEEGQQTEEDEQVLTVMVLGAGRGPLVRATLNAAEITGSKIEVLAIEKNPCAVVALVAQARELWVNKGVRVLAGDMRRITPPRPADIIVSELLGSWGDNELSPECLDGAAPLLRPGGLSIPSSYTSFAGPVSSARLWAAAKAAPSTTGGTAGAEKNLETLWVVYMQNKYDIAEAKPVFTFTHPAPSPPDADGPTSSHPTSPPDNRRCTHLSWRANQEAVLHGFAGYFSCELYGGESISIVPATHSAGMISWFPVFIPVKTPLRVNAGDDITATFWRCVSPRRVWYEWTASCGERSTPLHNPNGRSSEMLL